MLNEIYNRRVLELAADIPHLGRLEAPDATAKAVDALGSAPGQNKADTTTDASAATGAGTADADAQTTTETKTKKHKKHSD